MCLLCARYCSEYFTCINSLDTYSSKSYRVCSTSTHAVIFTLQIGILRHRAVKQLVSPPLGKMAELGVESRSVCLAPVCALSQCALLPHRLQRLRMKPQTGTHAKDEHTLTPKHTWMGCLVQNGCSLRIKIILRSEHGRDPLRK